MRCDANPHLEGKVSHLVLNLLYIHDHSRGMWPCLISGGPTALEMGDNLQVDGRASPENIVKVINSQLKYVHRVNYNGNQMALFSWLNRDASQHSSPLGAGHHHLHPSQYPVWACVRVCKGGVYHCVHTHLCVSHSPVCLRPPKCHYRGQSLNPGKSRKT